jgi:uncharacterized protein YciI
MENHFFLMRFVAHRSSFARDMTDVERKTMGQHVAYWTEQVRAGFVLMFGPVIDARESWGFGVLQVPSEAAARALADGDPAKALGRHELLPIPQLVR